jgi:uncharacterized membrane protein
VAENLRWMDARARERRRDALEDVDPDDWNAARNRRERARAERRARRVRERTDRPLLATRSGRVLVGSVALLAAATVAGLVLLWPGDVEPRERGQALGGPTLAATVTGERIVSCDAAVPQRCRRIDVRVGEGRDRGRIVAIVLGPVEVVSRVDVGTKVRVQRIEAAPGAAGTASYSLAGIDRRGALLWLLVAFVALVLLLTRLRGLLALVGFALSLALVTQFIVPGILAGSTAVLVSLVGSLAVMFVTVGLTYGISVQSLAASLGIALSLAFAALAGALAVDSAAIDGRSGELATVLSQTNSEVSLEGIVLAGLVIGALGVLADMGVTQVSAVMALRRANPALSIVALYRGAFTVGRDHLVATTHTLVLAYVGATLPLLLVLHTTGVPVTDALNSEDVAEPVIATLVGAMALLISVPLTTALAALLVHRAPIAALPDGAHPHSH